MLLTLSIVYDKNTIKKISKLLTFDLVNRYDKRIS
mgnify:CR=1 FL=1